jgi:hypothetical protein
MKNPVRLLVSTCFLFVLLMTAVSCENKKEAPQQTISIEDADNLEEEFKRTRSRILDSALGFQDTRDFWFSLDTLKKYIEYVEYEGRKMGKENLGIRIYFAAYPEQGNYPDPGYATVFLVPTAQAEPNPLKQGFFPAPLENQALDSLKALNYSQGGRPPNDL